MKFLHILFAATLLLMGCDSGDSTATQGSKPTYSYSGAQLLDVCTRADRDWARFCDGYLQAALDATGGKGLCIPKDLTKGDLHKRAVSGLQQFPDLQKSDAVTTIGSILRSAYPCN
jgi:hypothetical protein